MMMVMVTMEVTRLVQGLGVSLNFGFYTMI